MTRQPLALTSGLTTAPTAPMALLLVPVASAGVPAGHKAAARCRIIPFACPPADSLPRRRLQRHAWRPRLGEDAHDDADVERSNYKTINKFSKDYCEDVDDDNMPMSLAVLSRSLSPQQHRHGHAQEQERSSRQSALLNPSWSQATPSRAVATVPSRSPAVPQASPPNVLSTATAGGGGGGTAAAADSKLELKDLGLAGRLAMRPSDSESKPGESSTPQPQGPRHPPIAFRNAAEVRRMLQERQTAADRTAAAAVAAAAAGPVAATRTGAATAPAAAASPLQPLPPRRFFGGPLTATNAAAAATTSDSSSSLHSVPTANRLAATTERLSVDTSSCSHCSDRSSSSSSNHSKSSTSSSSGSGIIPNITTEPQGRSLAEAPQAAGGTYAEVEASDAAATHAAKPSLRSCVVAPSSSACLSGGGGGISGLWSRPAMVSVVSEAGHDESEQEEVEEEERWDDATAAAAVAEAATAVPVRHAPDAVHVGGLCWGRKGTLALQEAVAPRTATVELSPLEPKDREYQKAKSYALSLLQRSPQSAAALSRRLLARGHSLARVVTPLLDWLAAEGALNDRLYARLYAASRWNANRMAPNKIKQELLAQGVAAADVAAALEHVFGPSRRIQLTEAANPEELAVREELLEAARRHVAQHHSHHNKQKQCGPVVELASRRTSPSISPRASRSDAASFTSSDNDDDNDDHDDGVASSYGIGNDRAGGGVGRRWGAGQGDCRGAERAARVKEQNARRRRLASWLQYRGHGMDFVLKVFKLLQM